jgi:hypothetical protein
MSKNQLEPTNCRTRLVRTEIRLITNNTFAKTLLKEIKGTKNIAKGQEAFKNKQADLGKK